MRYWLMKAEPNSRIEKGKDVKFSVDDFETVKTTAWEGVRNHEAKKLMQSMEVGDQVLFYHSNCKNPGVAGFAEISKEAYPDYTAWDPEHPYYDPKSDKDSPRWFMVDATFKSRTAHFVPLTVFKRIASQPVDEPPKDVAYIRMEGVRAIKEMALVKRGRLSVQPVEEDAWKAVQLLAEKGEWEETLPNKNTAIPDSVKSEERRKIGGRTRAKKRKSVTKDDKEEEEAGENVDEKKKNIEKTEPQTRKRKIGAKPEADDDGEEIAPFRRSTRTKR